MLLPLSSLLGSGLVVTSLSETAPAWRLFCIPGDFTCCFIAVGKGALARGKYVGYSTSPQNENRHF